MHHYVLSIGRWGTMNSTHSIWKIIKLYCRNIPGPIKMLEWTTVSSTYVCFYSKPNGDLLIFLQIKTIQCVRQLVVWFQEQKQSISAKEKSLTTWQIILFQQQILVCEYLNAYHFLRLLFPKHFVTAVPLVWFHRKNCWVCLPQLHGTNISNRIRFRWP